MRVYIFQYSTQNWPSKIVRIHTHTHTHIYIYTRGGTQKFPELLKHLFKVFVQA